MTPALAKDIAPLREAMEPARSKGRTIGLVPTMGALHAGHLRLIETARAETGFVVVSIFVNPTQFGPNEDLNRYPRPLQRDVELCAQAGVDLVFHPEPAILYPPDYGTFVEVLELQDVLCGASRPGHFRGVATIVLKLFNLVNPDVAYFGQKDAQQVRIIQRMVADLNVRVRIRVCPIVRESDGLALSSRNAYLDADERRQATVLQLALREARQRIEEGERDADTLRQGMIERIAKVPGAVLDYAAIVDADRMEPLMQLPDDRAFLLALAVKFGATRLIDNLQLRFAEGGSRVEELP